MKEERRKKREKKEERKKELKERRVEARSAGFKRRVQVAFVGVGVGAGHDGERGKRDGLARFHVV